MPIELNHTIVRARDKHACARFLSEILGLPAPEAFGPFQVVRVGALSLDFADASEPIQSQHYAFLVSEPEFDAIFERIRARELPYWADPRAQLPQQINHHDGGRGVYWQDPSGHYLEIITRPYGG
jgi:catechol 2,3-dioxygenase-like lactoylglutathione lyase family enzyme